MMRRVQVFPMHCGVLCMYVEPNTKIVNLVGGSYKTTQFLMFRTQYSVEPFAQGQ